MPSDGARLVQAWYAALNAHDLEALGKVLADDFEWRLGTNSTRGRATSQEAWRLFFEAFPDFHFRVVRTFEHGATVVTENVMSGTHTGPLRFRGTTSLERPMAPTGKRFEVPTVTVHDVAGGRIARLGAYWDTATMLRQLGVSP